MTLARLASTLGVRAPSLYVHVEGLKDLHLRLAVRGATQLAEQLQGAAAGRAGADALQAIAQTYRGYALAHPGLYRALQRAPEDERTKAAAEKVVGVVLAVLRGYGLTDDDAIHATRVIRAALHGFVTLEASNGFGYPLSLEESYARLVHVLDQGLRRQEQA